MSKLDCGERLEPASAAAPQQIEVVVDFSSEQRNSAVSPASQEIRAMCNCC
jgi:hypothetical protein